MKEDESDRRRVLGGMLYASCGGRRTVYYTLVMVRVELSELGAF